MQEVELPRRSDVEPVTAQSGSVAVGIRASSSLAYIPGLDGVRALAVLAVIAFHFTAVYASRLEELGGAWSMLAKLTRTGWAGVDVFFVLSGFLIARLLAQRPIHSFTAYGAFLLRRVRRLMPASVVCLLVFNLVALVLAPGSKVLGTQWLAWTHWTNIESSFGDRGALADRNFSLVHFWSLALEWHFYLLLPLGLMVWRAPRGWAFLLIAMALLLRTLFVACGVSDNATYSFTFCRIDALAAGVLLAECIDWIPLRAVRVLGASGLCAFLALLVAITSESTPFKQLIWLQTWGYSAIALSAACWLAPVLRAGAFPGAIQWLESPPLAAIGRASYSTYLWHLVFFPGICVWAARHSDDVAVQFSISLGIASALTVVCSAASYWWIERRVIRPPAGQEGTHSPVSRKPVA